MFKIKNFLIGTTLLLITSISTSYNLKKDESNKIINNHSIESLYEIRNINIKLLSTTLPSSNKELLEKTLEENQEKKYVALTFDDGPSKYTNELLELLDKYGVKATFFVIEENCNYYPDQITNIKKHGHEIAIHGSTHTSFKDLSNEEIYDEIQSTINTVNKYGANSSELVRPPYGTITDEIKENIDYPFILWNIDTLDWKTKNKNKISAKILNNIDEGSIILMHDTKTVHKCDLEALEEVLPLLVDEYEFVTISDLYELNNKVLEPGKIYGKIKK